MNTVQQLKKYGHQTLDSQRIELLGRNLLIEQLIRGSLEVAVPLRDRGVDLIAYADLTSDVEQFVSRPIQLKAASHRAFSLDQKYARIAGLIFAFVWHVDSEEETRIYALNYGEALGIAHQLGWTKTASWCKGNYSNTRPGKNVEQLLESYLMTPEAWLSRLTHD